MVLLHLGTEEYFALNGVGAAIVRRLLELPWEQALAELSDTYDVDPTILEVDARELVESPHDRRARPTDRLMSQSELDEHRGYLADQTTDVGVPRRPRGDRSTLRHGARPRGGHRTARLPRLRSGGEGGRSLSIEATSWSSRTRWRPTTATPIASPRCDPCRPSCSSMHQSTSSCATRSGGWSTTPASLAALLMPDDDSWRQEVVWSRRPFGSSSSPSPSTGGTTSWSSGRPGLALSIVSAARSLAANTEWKLDVTAEDLTALAGPQEMACFASDHEDPIGG